jgi:hypothetical protein
MHMHVHALTQTHIHTYMHVRTRASTHTHTHAITRVHAIIIMHLLRLEAACSRNVLHLLVCGCGVLTLTVLMMC